MRLSLIAAAAALLWSAVAAQAANDGPWCYRDFSGPQFTNCSYYSARQCLAAVGALGGVCERNHAVPAPRAPARAKKG